MISIDILYSILISKDIIRRATDLTYFTDSVANGLGINPSDFMVRFLRIIDLVEYKNAHSVCDKIESLGFEQFRTMFENEFAREMVLTRIGNADGH